jgi:predicted aspartyl protease
MEEAFALYTRSLKLDPCSGRAHYDLARYDDFAGFAATAQHELDMSHSLSPDDPSIQGWWSNSHAVPMTLEQRLADLNKRLELPSLTQERKDGLNAGIKRLTAMQKGSCQLVKPFTQMKVPLAPMSHNANATISWAGLDVQLNGHRERLMVDTGASGLSINKAVAKSLGLVSEMPIRVGGFGDQGASKAFVTHVDDIKIGGMEFKNCEVSVIDSLGEMEIAGVIGTDVFKDYVVTLDLPFLEMRLRPLPPRPNEKTITTASLNTTEEVAAESDAVRARDRYVAPEMKDWTKVFRSGHLLIFPTKIGQAPVKLFVMDTGASSSLISTAAAREVTGVSTNPNAENRGISGMINVVSDASNITMTFGGVRQPTLGMTSINMSGMFNSRGIELSGYIGFETLRKLTISIDYRDNLVKIDYDANKAFAGAER